MSAVSSPDVRVGPRSATLDGFDRVPTAPVRDRYVDLVRVAAVVAVILGHWFVIAITVRDGRLSGQNVLAVLPWTHGLTWVFQVVPLFFFVGGYANAASWSAFANAGADWAGWLSARGERLLRPTTIYLAVALLAATVARAAGVYPDVVDGAAWLVAIHLWFLAIYLVVVAAAPMMLAAHRRWGATVVVLLVTAVAAVDVLRLGFDVPHIGMLNYALVWAAIHQVGFLWRGGALPQRSLPAAALAGAGLVALIVLTGPGPYPVSMVNVPGAELQPTAPPGLSILALAAFQAGVVLALRHPAERWLVRPRPRAIVARLGDGVMTLFLWHLVPVVFGAAILYATGLIPRAEIGSGSWLALRVVW
ncbi:MAG: acyltransferase, partial [Actinomycetota bacterium]|nr:acyltransferase [Actinomycetota bacterium]